MQVKLAPYHLFVANYSPGLFVSRKFFKLVEQYLLHVVCCSWTWTKVRTV